MQIDDLVKFVRIETPGILDEIIVQAIAAAAMDFCTKTRVWDEFSSPVALVDGQSQYAMAAPADARVLSIGDVWAADRELTPITMAALVNVLPNWQTAQGSQPQTFNAARDWNAITLFPMPMGAQGAGLTFRAQYAPRITSTTLPDVLADRFHDALIAGAKSRLMAQVNVGWSNPQMAIHHGGIYDQAVAQARIDQILERVPSSIRVRPVRFG